MLSFLSVLLLYSFCKCTGIHMHVCEVQWQLVSLRICQKVSMLKGYKRRMNGCCTQTTDSIWEKMYHGTSIPLTVTDRMIERKCATPGSTIRIQNMYYMFCVCIWTVRKDLTENWVLQHLQRHCVKADTWFIYLTENGDCRGKLPALLGREQEALFLRVSCPLKVLFFSCKVCGAWRISLEKKQQQESTYSVLNNTQICRQVES